MSTPHVELARRALDAIRRDPGEVFELGLAAPDMEFRPAREFDANTYVGAAGFAGFLATWTEPFERWELDLVEILEVEDERVVALARQMGYGKGSGVPVEMEFAIAFTFAGGVITGVSLHLDKDDALREPAR